MKRLEELKSPTGKVYLTLDYDSANNWIFNDWFGYVTVDNVMQGGLAFLEQMQKYGCRAGLNSNLNLVGPWDKSLPWIEEVWIPQAVRYGLRHYALVVREESFSQESAEGMQALVNGRFDINVLCSIEAAEQWLRKCLAPAY